MKQPKQHIGFRIPAADVERLKKEQNQSLTVSKALNFWWDGKKFCKHCNGSGKCANCFGTGNVES